MSLIGDYKFRFVNKVVALSGPELLADTSDDLLWDFNLHYFDGLHAAEPSNASKRQWVRDWIEYVPPGRWPAWAPFPLSRRLLNWIKWGLTSPADRPPDFDLSLAAQLRYLERDLEFDLMANHLMANAVALTIGGLYFTGSEGQRWLDKGTSLLAREVDEQFLEDGAHFELSPMYHCIVLEDLLDLIQVAHAVGHAVPTVVWSAVERACSWLLWITRDDGQIPLFNDAAYEVASEPQSLLRYARDLGFLQEEEHQKRRLSLKGASGYFVYRGQDLSVFGDVGKIGPDYQPGHGHCDMLSFELCWEGRPIVVDTGTSTYARGERRLRERGTAAHNTVQVGGYEQSEVWASFRVARRAEIRSREVGEDTICAELTGFPPLWIRHRRTWRFLGDNVEIHDRVLGSTEEVCRARLHFHPDVAVSGSGNRWSVEGLEITFNGAQSVHATTYHYAPAFNKLVPATVLVVDFEDDLRTSIGG